VASPGYIRTNLSTSALTGDGGLYAKQDATTASGADPNAVAIDILQKSASGKADFITAATFSAKAAIWLKFLAPSLLNAQLVKRYQKSQRENSD
jgi:dehydrogenase/reductase SDR family protein 7B